jgi:hypothetical protein
MEWNISSLQRDRDGTVSNYKHEYDHDYTGIQLKPIGLPADLEPPHHDEESLESVLALRFSDIIAG